MEIPKNASKTIDKLRTWFHPKDRPLILSDDAYLEINEQASTSILPLPTTGRFRIFAYDNSLYAQRDDGAIFPLIDQGLSVYLNLPGLRGFWPMSGYDSSLAATDLSGLGHHLTRNGNPQYNWAGLAPYIDFDGTGDYLSITDAASNNDFDILGNEDVANPGLTVYCWTWLNDGTTVQSLVAKDDGTIAGRNYFLNFRGGAGNQARILLGSGGSNYFIDSADALTTGAWYLIVGRYVPSTSVDVFVNISGVLTKTSNTTSIPASINNSAADLEIGGRGGGSLLNGRESMVAVCAGGHSDPIVENVFQQTRGKFGI